MEKSCRLQVKLTEKGYIGELSENGVLVAYLLLGNELHEAMEKVEQIKGLFPGVRDWPTRVN